jgi:hypothetical protein
VSKFDERSRVIKQLVVRRTPMKAWTRSVGAVALVAIVVGCEDGPSAPTPLTGGVRPGPPSPVPAGTQYHLVGLVVDEAGVPVPGAEMTFTGLVSTKAVTSDAAGAYEVVVESRQALTIATVQKAGYEPTRDGVNLRQSETTTRNLRLLAIRRVVAGSSIDLSIGLDNPKCGFELYICRRIRVLTPQAGTLMLEAVSNSSAQFGIVRAGDDPTGGTTARFLASVAANAEVAVDIILFWNETDPQPLTLRTELAPQ